MTSLGISQSNTPFIFSFSILISSSPITTPKNSTFLTFHLHFSGFMYKSFFANLLTTSSTILLCPSSSVPTIIGLALPRPFSSMFFGCFVFHDSFLHLYLSAYLISHALDPFKLYTNTPNYPDILLNSLLCTPLLFCNILWSSKVFQCHPHIYLSTFPHSRSTC